MVLKLHPEINPNINYFSNRALISARVQRSFTINDRSRSPDRGENLSSRNKYFNLGKFFDV